MVAHIKHTQGLEEAAIAVNRATAGGVAVRLCGNPLDPARVAEALAESTGRFVDPSFFAGETATRIDVCEHLVLLAHLYREHLLAGNVE